eukprot:scaffold11682_cov148-Skeletonema_dohrnii-CCMP3373.AAC.4
MTRNEFFHPPKRGGKRYDLAGVEGAFSPAWVTAGKWAWVTLVYFTFSLIYFNDHGGEECNAQYDRSGGDLQTKIPCLKLQSYLCYTLTSINTVNIHSTHSFGSSSAWFTSSCALSIALGVSSAINSSAFISSSLSPLKTTNHRVQQLIHAHAIIDADANIDIDSAELEKSSWIKAFNMVDKDNSGFIDKQELKACLTALGQPNSDDDISRLLSPVGITLTDELKIDQESFLSIVGAGIDEELDNNQVLQMYHAIDIDASGYITAAELQHFLGNLGMFLDDQTMSGLMNMYDDDGNGRITFGEFRDIVIDLGFAVSPVLEEDNAQVEQNDDVDTTEILTTTAHEDDTPENEGKLLSLSSITDEDLREALAPFDVDGSGTIDLLKVRDAAEGKGPAKLHYSDDRPMVGLADYVKSVNHVAILVSDVSRSLKFYSQVMGFEQIRR